MPVRRAGFARRGRRRSRVSVRRGIGTLRGLPPLAPARTLSSTCWRSRSTLATVRPTSSLTRTPQWANVSTTATSRAGQAERTFDGGGAAAAASSRSTSSGRNASTSPDDVRLTVSSGASHGLVGRWSRRTSQPQNPRIVDSARCRLDGARSAPSRSSARSSTSTSPSSVMTYCQPSSECGGNAGTCRPWTSLMAAAHRRRSARRARSELPGSSLGRPTRLAASQSSAISCHDGTPAGRAGGRSDSLTDV